MSDYYIWLKAPTNYSAGDFPLEGSQKLLLESLSDIDPDWGQIKEMLFDAAGANELTPRQTEYLESFVKDYTVSGGMMPAWLVEHLLVDDQVSGVRYES